MTRQFDQVYHRRRVTKCAVKDNIMQSYGEDIEASDSAVRTISDIMMEKGPKAAKLMSNLTNIIEVKKNHLKEMDRNYMTTRETISKLVAENDNLHQAYYKEIKEMQFSIRQHFQWVVNDYDITNLQLERQHKELEIRSIELKKREDVIKNERKKLEEEIKETTKKGSLLHLQRKGNENLMKLADYYKRGKEKLDEKILFLEKQVKSKDSKQALEAQKEKMKEHLNIMNRKREVVQDSEEKLEDLKSLNQVLGIKERLSNHELKETRKKLIKGLKKLPKGEDIGVKRMENINSSIFRNPNCHLFVLTCNGIPQGFIVQNNDLHEYLKIVCGEEIYYMLMTNYLEFNDSYKGYELWNFTESRKATLKEGVSCLLKTCDTQKRTRFT